MRRRIRRGHQRAALPHDRTPSALGPHQPAPSRRVRLRGEHRGRRRHPHPDSGQVPPPRVRAPGHSLPPAKDYGCGFVFLPRDAEQRDIVRALLHSIVDEEGQRLLGWREVPTDDHLIGASALSVEPHIMQVFIGRGPVGAGPRPLRAQALRDPQALREGRGGARHSGKQVRVHAEPRARTRSSTRACSARTRSRRCSRSDRSRFRIGAGPRAPAVQHEHVPVLAARASVPLHRPQRRDQHAARQHQLDEGARGAVPVGRRWATT